MRILTGLLLLLAIHAAAQDTTREQLFDAGWRFHRGGALGADKPAFNDAQWRQVDLPHDWSIEDLPGTQSPFSPDAISQPGGGFTTGGTGWYRKSFALPATYQDKRIHLQFDGIYMNAEVWLNGKRLGKHPYGYTSFSYDITERLKWDTINVLSVKVRNEGENSRWYAGSGIYRHVWLKLMGPVHVGQWGTYVTTPEVNATAAKVHLQTTVLNTTKETAAVKVVSRILNAQGREVAVTSDNRNMSARDTMRWEQDMTVSKPMLWSVQKPAMYTAVTEVYRNVQLTDRVETPFGIRTITADAVHGFRLNGQTIKLKGGCVHHDNGPLGAKAYDRAEERKVELLKAAGYNAIRCAHNPPSPAFLDACDRLGMLVIDEAFDTWQDQKNPEDYHLYFDKWWQRDVESMVYRDRNHPSVIMWSTGNEIPNRQRPEVARVAKMLRDYVRSIDSTRFITCGVNGIAEDKDAFLSTLDIAGYNYARDKYVPDHQRVPQRTIIATESFPLEAFDYWMEVEDHPWVLGDFVWTAFDYIGEASIGWLGFWQQQSFYPWNLAYCGDIDICGWKRPQSYYRDVLWKKDQLSVFVKPPQPSFALNPHKVDWSHWEWHDVAAHWNWQGNEGKRLEVNVYSSCEEVELFLEGRSLGRKPVSRANRFTAVWQVPYQEGTLKAIGYRKNKVVNTAILRTAGTVAKLNLSADRTVLQASTQDLSYVTVELQDANGVRHPLAEQLVQFEISGPAVIEAAGNANPRSVESYTLPRRKTWQGRCMVVVRTTGEKGRVMLKALVQGMEQAQIVLEVK
ncbi:glycoside hydrolase family 2 TIM barrel-domain containing protein [uncultured Chitinophaga sp.]|jgi:Beta-galactosidase/beta-glucuronidase|uniref:glycoside hydrolase family 2 TIM barrel-domain containing protein n=1 Tax=uncultured Chitinophaga sp. TaxID=339340 RepID=UPI00261DF540|nr:glycoside hydrolase family 2 TIM barrel-domain containing protein [uncultured Chitinophaga sp.]